MSYYPMLNAPNCKGWVTLCNFAPNNWEITTSGEKYINVTWASGDVWRTQLIGKLEPGQMRKIVASELDALVPKLVLPLLSLSSTVLPPTSEKLPLTEQKTTAMPAWRATLGLSTDTASTSYQGELDPFPAIGSLLTFGPFLQFGSSIENYLIFLNIERSPVERAAVVEIFDAESMRSRGKMTVCNNRANVIELNRLGFGESELPVVVCKGMSGIPLYFSATSDGRCLSLEHTHPPASLVIHGKRLEVQRMLKKRWLARAGA